MLPALSYVLCGDNKEWKRDEIAGGDDGRCDTARHQCILSPLMFSEPTIRPLAGTKTIYMQTSPALQMVRT